MKKIAFLAIALAFTACGNKQEMPEASNDFAVVTVEATNAALETSYPATIKGMQDIEIRPKVAGHITRVLVDEGQFVKKGQRLFIIDEVQYAAAVEAAQASIKVVEANIATQKLTVDNKKMLYDRQIVSKYDYDLAVNQLKSLEAQLETAKSQLTSARQNLSYCIVTSPADGVVGMIPFRVGSLVSSSSAQPLTTVSNISEMYVYFSMTEKQLLEMTKGEGGVTQALESMPEVTLTLADGTKYAQKGKITAISGVIDRTTGAVQMRATFDNTGKILRSGGTGSISIPTDATSVITVPQKATFDIQDKKFVYIVEKDNTVKSREITVLPQHDGVNYVLTSGLKAGERIVVDGVNQLKGGQKINPITPEQAAKNVEKAKADLEAGKLPGEK